MVFFSVYFSLTDAIKYCKVCNTTLETATVGALGHDMKDVEGTAKAATCEADGKEADRKCSRCDAVEEGAVIKSAGHKFEEKTIEATCTTAGGVRNICSVCNKTEVKSTIDALGHNMIVVTAGKAATCYEPGYTDTTVCTRCSFSQASQILPKLTHKFVDGICQYCQTFENAQEIDQSVIDAAIKAGTAFVEMKDGGFYIVDPETKKLSYNLNNLSTASFRLTSNITLTRAQFADLFTVHYEKIEYAIDDTTITSLPESWCIENLNIDLNGYTLTLTNDNSERRLLVQGVLSFVNGSLNLNGHETSGDGISDSGDWGVFYTDLYDQANSTAISMVIFNNVTVATSHADCVVTGTGAYKLLGNCRLTTAGVYWGVNIFGVVTSPLD